ncbi:MAG: hypothetical protein HOP28_06150 [Gemmatimonadales bacterium]|nr:hypothetical protein [Gemmatimonadales bacterium]
MRIRMPLRYASWMLRDALRSVGVIELIVIGLMTFLLINLRSAADGKGPSGVTLLAQLVTGFDWVVVMVATGGIVATDLTRGYFRTLFSEPVSPPLYYLQRWLVGAVAVGLSVPIAGIGVLVADGSFVFSGAVLVRLLLLYLLLGGLTFMLSTLLRRDWLFALLIFIVQTLIQSLSASGLGVGPTVRAIVRALPPFHLVEIGPGVPTYPGSAALFHVLVYGAVLVGIAVTVLAYRPLGTGGRE